MFDRLSEDQRQVLNIVPEGHNVFITGQGGTARKNNCLLSSIFPAGEGGFGQMMYRSTILACLFPLEFEFRGKLCAEREHGGENGISCLLPCILLLYIQ